MKKILLIVSFLLLVTSCSIDKQESLVVSEKEVNENPVFEGKSTDNNIIKENNINYSNLFTFSKTWEHIYNVIFSPDKKDVIHTEYITDKWLKKQIVFKNWKKFYECNDVKSFYTSSVGIDTVSFKFSKDSQSLAFICSNWTNHQVILNGKNIWEYQEIKSYLFDNENNFIFWWKNDDRAFINIWWSEKELDYEYIDNIVVSSKNELAYNVIKDNKSHLVKWDQLLNKYDYNEYPAYSVDGGSFSYRVWNLDNRDMYIVKDDTISDKSYGKLWESFYWDNDKLYTFVGWDNNKICLLIDFKEKECFDNINLWGFKFSDNLKSYIYSIWEYWDEYSFIKDWYVWEKFHSIASYKLQISDNWESYWFWAEKEDWWESWIYKDWDFLNDDDYYFTNNLVYWDGEDFAYVWFKKIWVVDWKDQTEIYVITNNNTYWPFETYHNWEYWENWELYFIVTNKRGDIEYNKW